MVRYLQEAEVESSQENGDKVEEVDYFEKLGTTVIIIIIAIFLIIALVILVFYILRGFRR